MKIKLPYLHLLKKFRPPYGGNGLFIAVPCPTKFPEGGAQAPRELRRAGHECSSFYL